VEAHLMIELALDYSLARGAGEPLPDTAPIAAPTGRQRFENLLDRHHARLRRVAAGVLRRPDALDDVLQEAYLKAYRSLPVRFASDAHESAWLYRIVYHCCLDELKRRRRRGEVAADLEALPAGGGDPLDPIAVEAALAALSAQDRAVLFLVDYAGFDYDTAGEVLSIPRGTVASRLNAARSRFRAAFGAIDG
jgi:RNA polymerase sigma-70 factor (ECF subfamily)